MQKSFQTQQLSCLAVPAERVPTCQWIWVRMKAVQKEEHYMELTENEEAMFDMVKENFEKVIVLINSSSPMELGFLENEKVDAAMWPSRTGIRWITGCCQCTLRRSQSFRTFGEVPIHMMQLQVRHI